MKKNIIILAAIIACLCSCSEENNVSSFSFEVTPQIVADNDAAEYNYSRTLFLRDSVKAVITYSEDWHDIAEIRKGEKKLWKSTLKNMSFRQCVLSHGKCAMKRLSPPAILFTIWA